MHRSRTTSVVLLASLLLPLGLLAACGGGGEERRVIDNFFRASSLRDSATLANISAVTFDPNEDGTVRRFSVTDPGQEERWPLRIRELEAELEEARRANEEFDARKKEYQDANMQAIERVLKAERESAAVPTRDRDVQQAWTEWREETITHARQLSDARAALADERAIPEASVFDPRQPVEISQYEGEMITRNVSIRATVRQPDGTEAERDMVITMQRVELHDGPDGDSRQGRWIITRVQ